MVDGASRLPIWYTFDYFSLVEIIQISSIRYIRTTYSYSNTIAIKWTNLDLILKWKETRQINFNILIFLSGNVHYSNWIRELFLNFRFNCSFRVIIEWTHIGNYLILIFGFVSKVLRIFWNHWRTHQQLMTMKK